MPAKLDEFDRVVGSCRLSCPQMSSNVWCGQSRCMMSTSGHCDCVVTQTSPHDVDQRDGSIASAGQSRCMMSTSAMKSNAWVGPSRCVMVASAMS
jgi:hypothetical protein